MKRENLRYKIVLLTFAILTATGLYACKKFLSLSPNSSFSEDYVFSNPNDAYKAVLGVYSNLTGDLGYGQRMSYYFCNDADDAYMNASYTASVGGDNSSKAVARYNALATNIELDPIWNRMYTGIDRANHCIKSIPTMPQYTNGTATDKANLQRLYGEALTLRAQLFFDLIKLFGDVPAPYLPSTDQPNLNLPATNRDSIYNHILDDLKTAESLLPWRGDAGIAPDERITKGSAKALRARIALFRGGYSLRAASRQMERSADYIKFYQIARDECADIISSGKHKLNPSFQAVFKDNIDAHKIDPDGEILFSIAMSGGTGATDSRMGYLDGTKVNGLGFVQTWALPTYFYKFDSLDVRRDVTIATYDIDASGNYIGHLSAYGPFLMAKYRRDWHSNPVTSATNTSFYFGLSWPLIRYSDVLLMFAEADNEINHAPSAAAIDAFKQVRTRGFNGDATKIGVVPTDYSGFFNAIVDERMFEFGDEGLRKWDLIRWNLINSIFTQTRANLAKFRLQQAPYDKVPTIMYYLNNSKTGLVYYSSYYQREPKTAPTGYTSVRWTSSYQSNFNIDWAGSFVPNQRELLPIGIKALASNPNLKQGYGY